MNSDAESRDIRRISKSKEKEANGEHRPTGGEGEDYQLRIPLKALEMMRGADGSNSQPNSDLAN